MCYPPDETAGWPCKIHAKNQENVFIVQKHVIYFSMKSVWPCLLISPVYRNMTSP